MIIEAGETISTASAASVQIDGDARFVANRVLLGNGVSDQFNTGRISFEVSQPSEIREDSSLRIFGRNNFAFEGITLGAEGNITAAGDTLFRADSREFASRLEATGNIILGNEAQGRIVIRELGFEGEFVRLTLDGTTNLNGENSASRLRLRIMRPTQITDAAGASLNVLGNATFIVDGISPAAGGEIILGDSPDDFFRADTISFRAVNGVVDITSSSRTVITSENTGFLNVAETLIVDSAGDLLNDVDSRINISVNAALSGSNIAFGQASSNDFVNFNLVNVTTSGNLTLGLNGQTSLVGANTIGGNALIAATGRVQLAGSSSFSAGGQTSVFGSSILLSQGSFSTETLRFGSGGSVNIVQYNDIVLAEQTLHSAGDLFLQSAGSISGLDGAQLSVGSSLRLRAAGDVDLDVTRLRSLNFQSAGNVTINALFDSPTNQERIFLFGVGANRVFANGFSLTTNVDVRDGATAFIEVDEFMEIFARNIVLGDSDVDCLAIPADAVFNTSQNAPNVTTNPTCPI